MLSKKLKQIRQKTGISQGKLAKLLVEKGKLKTCTPAYISSLENKQFSNFYLFCDICEVMDVQVDVVLHYA